MIPTKTYIGDSVYAAFDGHGMVLTTENGDGPSNTIYLEPEVKCVLDAFWLASVSQLTDDE